MNQEQVHQAYQQLIEQFNQARLVGDTNRVPLLKRLVAALGHPEQHYHVIHIAGTNGKAQRGPCWGPFWNSRGTALAVLAVQPSSTIVNSSK
ncbi:hypothetical protein [Secundilactobacillus similis]|uniref:hypothetical protein n=1 Tax=Secundilactobacillus similis TaxID=414682 RepID=UPI000B2F8C00|nr:hypothetical protein [Secundilactobacillus similis]